MKQRRRVLVVPGWLHPPMIGGLARCAREANWHLHLINVMTGAPPRGLAWDGMLVFHTERADLIRFARQQAAHCPTVLISAMKPILSVPVVKEDNVAIGRLAAEHFMERGFRQFVWLSNDRRQCSYDRRAGFLAALHEAGLPCDCIEWHKMPRGQGREWNRAVARQLRTLPLPLALFALDDIVAVEAVEILKDNGFRVPEDVAVLGVGNAELMCDFSEVPLSSIEMNWPEIVYRAGKLLDDLISGGQPPDKPLIFPPRHVVVRASTDTLGMPGRQLATALEFIRDHFCEQIGVRDVARSAGVVRRTLEYQFRSRLHHGVAEEIRRRRLDYARELLLKTDLPVMEIAQQAGFDSPLGFAKVFKRAMGRSPTQYRAAAGSK